MFEKIAEAVFAYGFAILELFGAFLERTHAIVGMGLPILVMAAVHLFLPIWVGAGLAAFVVAPAAAAMATIIAECLVLTRER